MIVWHNEVSSSYINNPWQYLSKRVDEETNLVFFGRRYYDPETGRWLTPDPQGFDNGLNLYAYVLNDPLIKLDLYGLETNDFSKVEFPNTNLNFLLNINLNFQSYWKYLMFMKIQSLEFNSNQKTNFFSNGFDFAKNFANNTVNFSSNFAKGIFEVFTGIKLASPSTRIGTYGRILGRNTAKLYADTSFILGLVMTTGGTFTSGATPILATVGGPVGIATAAVSPALIAGGIVTTAHGIVLHRNYDKLNKLEISNNEYKTQSTHEIAKQGDRHSGQYNEFMKQTPKQLQKSIRSFDKQIKKHKNWINNPTSKVKNWNKLTFEHQNNLLHHWNKDINRAEEFKQIAETMLNNKF